MYSYFGALPILFISRFMHEFTIINLTFKNYFAVFRRAKFTSLIPTFYLIFTVLYRPTAKARIVTDEDRDVEVLTMI